MIRCLAAVFSVLLFANLGLANDPKLIGNWRSANIPHVGGMAQMKLKYNFLDEINCQLIIEVSFNTPVGSGASRDTYECTYQTFPGQKVDLTIKKYFLTILDARSVAEANEKKECGLSDWKIGVAKDISGLVCKSHDGFAPGDVFKELYEISEDSKYSYFGTDYTKDNTSMDPDVERDEEGRPVRVSKKVTFATDGVIPPDVELDPTPIDTLTGLYEVKSSSINKNSCDSEGSPEVNQPKYIYMYPMKLIFSLGFGWLGKECKALEGCEKPGTLFSNHPWIALTVNETGTKWASKTDTSKLKSEGLCLGTRQIHEIARAEDDSMVFQLKTFETTVAAGPSSEEPCDKHDPALEAALSAAKCSSFRVVKTGPLSR